MSDSWRWDPGEHRHYGHSWIDVIEPAEPREIPPGARTVAFGFSRALEVPTSEQVDGWDEHAAIVAGLDREGLAA
jgi:hypothetical protein